MNKQMNQVAIPEAKNIERIAESAGVSRQKVLQILSMTCSKPSEAAHVGETCKEDRMDSKEMQSSGISPIEDDLNEIERGQICRSAYDSFRSTEFGLANFPGLLKKIIRYRAWEKRDVVTVDERPTGRIVELASLRELITAKPIRGWGEDLRTVEAVIKDDPECLAMFREAMKEQSHDRGNQHTGGNRYNITVASTATGTSRAYSIDRVQRECAPEVVAKVMSGEMSPHAALVNAGIRQNRQVYIPTEPAKAVAKLRELFGSEFVNAMVDHVVATGTNRSRDL